MEVTDSESKYRRLIALARQAQQRQLSVNGEEVEEGEIVEDPNNGCDDQNDS